MLNNFEKFIAGELVISLFNEDDVYNFISSMQQIGFTSIEDNISDAYNQKEEDIVVQYLPNLGFRYVSLQTLKLEIEDLITDEIPVVKWNQLFTAIIPSVA